MDSILNESGVKAEQGMPFDMFLLSTANWWYAGTFLSHEMVIIEPRSEVDFRLYAQLVRE